MVSGRPCRQSERLEDCHPSSPMATAASSFRASLWVSRSAAPWPGGGASAQLPAPRVPHLMLPLVLLSTEIKTTRRKSSEFQFDSETLPRTLAQDSVSRIALRS